MRRGRNREQEERRVRQRMLASSEGQLEELETRPGTRNTSNSYQVRKFILLLILCPFPVLLLLLLLLLLLHCS